MTLARMVVDDILVVLDEWKSIYEQRSREDGIEYVQIFEVRVVFFGSLIL